MLNMLVLRNELDQRDRPNKRLCCEEEDSLVLLPKIGAPGYDPLRRALLVALGATLTVAAMWISIHRASFLPAAAIGKVVSAQEQVKIGFHPAHEEQLPKSRSVVEVSEDNSVWQVVSASAPVIMKLGRPHSRPIGYKRFGQILVGIRVGSMVKLTHDFGLVPIQKPHGGSYLIKQTLSYRIVREGTCASVGFSPIHDPTLCAAAASALGYVDRHVTQYTGNFHRPEGCYMHEGLIWMTMSDADKGRGVVALSFPICSRVTVAKGAVVLEYSEQEDKH